MEVNVVGMDVGFRKTGLTVFRLGPRTDTLIKAITLESEFERTKNPAAEDDFVCVLNILPKIDEILDHYNARGLFAEIPHGGGQGARALRCMGLATGWAAALLHYRNIAFEFFTPGQVEKQIGIYMGPNEVKALGLKKGEATKYKKERIQQVVMAAFPSFTHWPKRKELAEDSYDSAAAFLCGRGKNALYARLKKIAGE